MKKILITIFFLSIVLEILAQDSPYSNRPSTSADLFLKSKKQKTAARILLGGGSALALTGFILSIPKASNDIISVLVLDPKESDYTVENIMIITGGVAMAGSIPLFIASGQSRRSARLMVKDEKVAMGLPIKAGKKITGITLSIPIGK